MIKKLCTYLVTGSILASTVLSPLQTYATDFEPETKIEYESTEELLNEEEKEELGSNLIEELSNIIKDKGLNFNYIGIDPKAITLIND